MADEGLVLGHDVAHGGLDALEVLVAEGGPAGQLEVVVEAVLDDRADGEMGAGPQAEHGLGQDVGGRVAQDGPPGLGIGGDHTHLGPVRSGASRSTGSPSKVAARAALARRGPMDSASCAGGGTLAELLGRAIRQSNADASHGIAFLHRVVTVRS